jgi:predicted transposase/invertase (TIGR01784 family)
MARYLNPKNDLTFKRVFGEHPDLLISFLNALMPLAPDRKIECVEYLSAEQVPDNPLKKNSIVDVRCRDNFGRQFIVEMQMYWNDTFNNRLVFNASKAYVRELDKGKSYELLQPVYGLGIVDDTFDKKSAEFYHHYQIINRNNTEEIIDGLEFVLVELPKFKAERWADRKMAVLWLRFLNEVEESNRHIAQELMNNSDIRKAIDLCEEGAFTEGELAAYEKYWDIVRTENAVIATERAEGKAEGKAEGLAEGLGKGKMEEKIEVIVESHAIGLPVETIATITRLSPGEVIAVLQREGKLP